MEKWLYVMFIEKTKSYNKLNKGTVTHYTMCENYAFSEVKTKKTTIDGMVVF